MQLVSIEGGHVDYEDFEECGVLDFYGPLRKEYGQYTIIPKQYAARMPEY